MAIELAWLELGISGAVDIGSAQAQWLRFGEHSAGGDIAANDKELFPYEEVLLLTEYRRLEPDSQAVVRDLISSLLTHHALRK